MGRPQRRKGARKPRRDRLLREREHDPYKSRGKLPGPTACPECGVVFQKGRWQWTERPEGCREALCPACQRVHDRCPAGYLTLSGAFFREHRDEIVQLANNVEAREKNLHPLRRIMAVADQDDGILITTTEMEMARTIGDAIHHAYQGTLDYLYTAESNILRVSWSR